MMPVLLWKQTRMGRLDRKEYGSFVHAWRRMEVLQKNGVYWAAIVWDRPRNGSQNGSANVT